MSGDLKWTEKSCPTAQTGGEGGHRENLVPVVVMGSKTALPPWVPVRVPERGQEITDGASGRRGKGQNVEGMNSTHSTPGKSLSPEQNQ